MTKGNGQGLYSGMYDPILANRLEELRQAVIRNEQTSLSRLRRGGSMDPRRDIDEECGYPKTDSITTQDYKNLFEREPVAARVVEVLPDESWRSTPTVYEDEDANAVTPFEEAWDALADSLCGDSWYAGEEGNPVWEHLHCADVLSGIGDFGVLLLGLDDGKRLSEPAEFVVKKRPKPGEGTDDEDEDEDEDETQNTFCPTGDGGGVDPLCSSGTPGGKTDYQELMKDWMDSAEPFYKDAWKKGQRTVTDAVRVLSEKQVQGLLDKHAVKGHPTMAAVDRGEFETGGAFSRGFGLTRLDGNRYAIIKDSRPAAAAQRDENLTSTVTNVKTSRRLLFLRALDRSCVDVVGTEKDKTNRRYGQPVSYNLKLSGDSGVGGLGETAAVHWTRVIHLADNHGAPRMRPVLDRLLDIRKILPASAETFYRGLGVFSLETHPQLGGDVEVDTDDLKDDMEQLFNGLQRYILTRGMSAKMLAPAVVDPTPQMDAQITAICIKLNIPKRIFMGSERGELASSQDERAWNMRMKARQQNYITPRIIVPFVDRLILLGVLPEPEEYNVDWPDHEFQTEMEKAQVAVAKTAALAQYVSGGVADLMDPLDWLTRVLGMTEEEADAVLQVRADTLVLEEESAAKAQQEQQASLLEQQEAMAKTGQPPPGQPSLFGKTKPPQFGR